MYDAADPDAGKLYFTQAHGTHSYPGARGGEFDLDESGSLPGPL